MSANAITSSYARDHGRGPGVPTQPIVAPLFVAFPFRALEFLVLSVAPDVERGGR